MRSGTRSKFIVNMMWSVWEIIKQTFWPVEKLIRGAKAKRRAPFEDTKISSLRTQHKKPFDSFPICKMICAICLRFYEKFIGYTLSAAVHSVSGEWADVQCEMLLLALIKNYLAHNFFFASMSCVYAACRLIIER